MLSSRFSIMPFPIPAISAMAYELIKPDRMRMPIQPNCAHMPLRPVPACKTRRDTRWNTRYRNAGATEVELVELVAYIGAKVPSICRCRDPPAYQKLYDVVLEGTFAGFGIPKKSGN